MAEPTIANFSNEDRTFPPSPEFLADALVTDRAMWAEADADYEAFWARQARELLTWFEDFDTTLEWDLPFSKWFVGGKLNVSYNCLDRHVEAGRGGKVAIHWEGEPGDTRTFTYSELLAEVERFANALEGPGVDRGGPHRHLHADDSRAADRHVGLHPHRGGPLGDLRRVQPRLDHRPLQRRRGQGHHHRRRRLSPRRPVRAQGQRRRRRRVMPHGRRTWSSSTAATSAVTMEPGRDHWWHELMAAAAPDVPARAARQRAPALPALHLGHHRQAQGHHAHHRRVPHPGGVQPQVHLRPAPRDRHLLVRGRRRLGDRAQLHRLRAARQRRDFGDVRGHARHAPARVPHRGPGRLAQGPPLGHHRALQGHPALHGPNRDPHVHEVGHAGAGAP